jgi:site-specific DNA-methyltransferase (adenine-specific)
MFSASAEYLIFATNGPRLDHDGAPQNVFACAPDSDEDKEHIAQKPEAVVKWAMRALPPGAVLDPFMGSGTILRVAKDLGRQAIGIEIEERYAEIAAKRLSQEVLPLDDAPLLHGAPT